MSILLYDLAMADDRRFSPYCWRTRMSLWHKGLDFDTRPTGFTQIKSIADGRRKTIPVIEDNGRIVEDSFQIAVYLDEVYPDRPSLFRGEGGRAVTRFLDSWMFDLIRTRMLVCYVKDIHDALMPADRDYFRSSREARWGAPLEKLQKGREGRLADFHRALAPLATTLARQPFLGGEGPLYADYIVFASLNMTRVATSFAMLPEPGDPVRDWFERCLDLFDGAPRAMPVAA